MRMNNEEKILQLLESMQSDIAGLKQGQDALTEKVDSLETHVSNLNSRMDKLDNRFDKLELRLENEVIDKIRALYNARQSQQDINERIINTLARIEAKIDVLQMETASIRRIK